MVTTGPLNDRYEIESQIAVGGMGIVYRARDLRLERSVAVKILKDHLSHDERFVERFRREARAVASLTHLNIATLFDYGEDGGRHFIVMECVDGRNLATVIREEGALEPTRAAYIARQMCDALAVAHRAGIVHRDIKPGNVLVTSDDLVKVTDFGIARATGDSTLTATGSILGTAHYLAPEQAAGEQATAATDIYATGVVLFEMLTGAPPFAGDSPVAIATQHMNAEVPSPRALDPSVPQALENVVHKATAKAPQQRYLDAASMSSALIDAASQVRGGAGIAAAAPASAAVTTELDEPIAGTRELPSLGDRVRAVSLPPLPSQVAKRPLITVIAGLAAIALVLLTFRLAQNPKTEPASGARDGQKRSNATPAPPVVTLVVVPDVEDREVGEAVAMLEAEGFTPAVTGEEDGWWVESATPAPGSEVEEGSTVTLTVVAPDEEEDDDDDDENGPPGHAEGKGKGKDKEKDD